MKKGFKRSGPGIITLLSDFGLQDGYVASMKGVILGIAPAARLIDISHLIAPQDIRSAAFVLFTSYSYFPPGAIHLAVVDPGVGAKRRAIAVRTPSCCLVGPDNGIFSLILSRETGWEARTLENTGIHRKPVSNTFHGRDIFAPVAAHLASGVPFEVLGPACSPAISQWASPLQGQGSVEGEVIHIDRFGNAITNVAPENLGDAAAWRASAGNAAGLPVLDTYSGVPPGTALVVTGSSDFLEVAVNQGSAAARLGLTAGSKVLFSA